MRASSTLGLLALLATCVTLLWLSVLTESSAVSNEIHGSGPAKVTKAATLGKAQGKKPTSGSHSKRREGDQGQADFDDEYDDDAVDEDDNGEDDEHDVLDFSTGLDTNELINHMIDDAKSGHGSDNREIKVVRNSNDLNHESSHGGSLDNFESQLQRTIAMNKQAHDEDAKKDKQEHTQKQEEAKNKSHIRKERRKLEQQLETLSREQDQKQAKEDAVKRVESGRKAIEEQGQKQKAHAMRKQALVQATKARSQLNKAQLQEAEQKRNLVRKTDDDVKNFRKIASQRRIEESKREEQDARNEEEHKHQERKKHEQRDRQAEKLAQERERRELAREAGEKQSKANAEGKWCNCKKHRVQFEQFKLWLKCPPGHLLAGLYRGNEDYLNGIYYFECCQPCKDDGATVLNLDCTSANWVHSFDREGWSYCPADSYVSGFYKSTCNWIYCLEYAECCKIQGSKGRKGCTHNQKWVQTLDKAGWSPLDKNMFAAGIYRSHAHYLHNIELVNQCTYHANK